MDAMAAGADGAGAAAAPDTAADAATKPDKAADDTAKAVEAEAAPKPVVKPRRDRKVGPLTTYHCPDVQLLPFWSSGANHHNLFMFGLLYAAASRIASLPTPQAARTQGKAT